MKNSFTLVEVLVSVMIISLVGIALLDLSAKSVKIVSFLKKKEATPLILAFATNHFTKNQENLEKNFLDEIGKVYDIQSHKLRKALDKNVLYTKKMVQRIELDGNSSELGQIEIFKQTVKTNNATSYIYTIELPKKK